MSFEGISYMFCFLNADLGEGKCNGHFLIKRGALLSYIRFASSMRVLLYEYIHFICCLLPMISKF